MTKEEYRAAIGDVVYLVSCAANEKTPDAEKSAAMNLSHVYAAAEHHLLSAAVGMALQSAGIRDAQITQAMAKAQRKNALLDADRVALLARLEQENIWYMPLKGSVLKDLYPQYGMRQMADNDILIDADRAEDVKTIMESLGFTTVRFGKSNHDVYHKPPVSNFEIHTALFGLSHEQKIYQYYRDVKSRLVKDKENLFGWHFADENYYIYITAHEYKHYSNGGTGLRSILDTYVFLKRFEGILDWRYIHDELEKLGIAEFENQNRSLALHLFGGGTLTPEDETMLQYIIGSGAYGTWQNYVGNRVRKLGGGRKGKLKYLMSRIFLPMDSVESGYPFFYRHKALLPVLFVWRILKGLTIRRSMVSAELKALRKNKA